MPSHWEIPHLSGSPKQDPKSSPVADHFLTRAKAYAALVGSVLTAVGSQLPDDPTVQKWLGIGLALSTAVATFTIPNKKA